MQGSRLRLDMLRGGTAMMLVKGCCRGQREGHDSLWQPLKGAAKKQRKSFNNNVIDIETKCYYKDAKQEICTFQTNK